MFCFRTATLGVEGLTHYRPAVPRSATEKKKNILENLFSLVLSQFKKYHPSRNLKFNY